MKPANHWSAFPMSATTFQLPSACFFQTVMYLPVMETGSPLRLLPVSCQAPTVYPRSPEAAQTT